MEVLFGIARQQVRAVPSRSSHLWKHDAMNRRTSALSLPLSCGSISGILILLLRLSTSVGGSAAVLE